MEPACWKCALKRNPFMVLVVFIAAFFLCGLMNIALFLTAAWIIGMGLFLMTPRRYFTMPGRQGQIFYFFCYDTYDKWKLDIADRKRSAFLRVFYKQDGKIMKVGTGFPMKINGFDDSLLSSGFFLVKRPNFEWVLWGNGYDENGRPLLLGRKMADYFFIFVVGRKVSTHFIHGQKVITDRCEGVQKIDTVLFDSAAVSYVEIIDGQRNISPAETAGEKDGCFIFIKKKDAYFLYKIIHDEHGSSAYAVKTDAFSFSRSPDDRHFTYLRGENGCYYEHEANRC